MANRDGSPFDGNFTTWVPYPGSPSKFGSSDLNRIQFDLDFLANPPSCRVSRSDTHTIANTLEFVPLYWNVTAWSNDPQFTAWNPVGALGTGTGNYIERLILPYPGEWEAQVVVRSQFNNTAGISQIQLARVDANNANVLIDQDIQPCNVAYPNNMRINAKFLITQAMVDNFAGVQVQYAQNSGGNAAVYATAGVSAYPSLAVKWIGTGNL